MYLMRFGILIHMFAGIFIYSHKYILKTDDDFKLADLGETSQFIKGLPSWIYLVAFIAFVLEFSGRTVITTFTSGVYQYINCNNCCKKTKISDEEREEHTI